MEKNSGEVFFTDRSKEYPVLEHGEGIFLYDTGGNRYIDGTSGIAVANVGHGRTEIADAVMKQSSRLGYGAPNIFSNEPARRLAMKLGKMAQGDLSKFHFVSGGSEAVEVAMKLSRQYFWETGETRRFKIISRDISYHGATLGALSISGHTGRRKKFLPMLLDFPRIPACYCYRCPFQKTYPGCDIECARRLDSAIRAAGPESVSAFIAEPVVGAAGGALVPPDGYFQVIEDICRKWGILFISDEVMTGFGRTGKLFAMEHWDMVPDLVTVAKALSGGYAPLGAVMIGKRVAKAFEKAAFDHVFTFGAHPVAAAAALEVLDIIEREDLVARAREMGSYLREGLESLLDLPLTGDVRGLGLMAGVELVQDKGSREPFAPEMGVSSRVAALCLKKGLVIYPGSGTAGDRGDHFLLCPPLVIEKGQIDDIIRILEEVLLQVGRDLSPR